MHKLAILFVCTGNICRSPTAEGVMSHVVQKAGLSQEIQVDSAGTIDFHSGEAPDPRAVIHAQKKGYDLSSLCARQIQSEDFDVFDLILAMDCSHLAVLHRLCPDDSRHKVHLFLEYAGITNPSEVPDPYYGDAADFDHALSLVEAGCEALLAKVQSQQPMLA